MFYSLRLVSFPCITQATTEKMYFLALQGGGTDIYKPNQEKVLLLFQKTHLHHAFSKYYLYHDHIEEAVRYHQRMNLKRYNVYKNLFF